MAKTINGAIGFVSGTTPTANYIKQINAGGAIHDIAVEHGIKFFNGSSEILWDGQQPVEVVIPTLADIVANPVVLKGVINKADDVPSNDVASNGDLYYIGTTGKYFTPEVACEAGDMAIYYDKKWNVISGENQIKLISPDQSTGNKVAALGKNAVDVLDVEGKKLSLAIDYADVRKNVSVSLNPETVVNVRGGKVSVSGKSINLSQASGTTTNITTAVSIALPTALNSGNVTISDNVLSSGDFTFNSGSFPTIAKNTNAITVNASHNMTVVASGSGSFVTGVEAIKSVTFEGASVGDAAIAYVSGINRISGTSFVSGIHAHTTSDGDKPVDFTVAGVVTAPAVSNTFATSFSEASTSGDVVSAVTVGKVTGTFVTGLSGNGTSVVTSVKVGDASLDTTGTRDWFVTGLADNASAVTGVNFGSVSVTPKTSSAFVSASVSNHVLSFTTGNFMTSATAALTGTGVTTKTFTKGGVKLTDFSSTSDTLKTGGVSQAATSISYKSLNTGVVTLSQETVGYHLDKASSTEYDALMGYKKFSFTNATVTTSGASLSNTGITASIPANSVAVGLNAGTLPSLSIGAPSKTISGTVDTTLSTVSKSWLAVKEANKEITIPGAYSLVEVTQGGIEVAVANESGYNVDNATVTIGKDQFVTDVFVDGTKVSVKA